MNASPASPLSQTAARLPSTAAEPSPADSTPALPTPRTVRTSVPISGGRCIEFVASHGQVQLYLRIDSDWRHLQTISVDDFGDVIEGGVELMLQIGAAS